MERAFQAKMQVQEGDKGKKKNKKNIKQPVVVIKELEIFLLLNTVRKQITYINITSGDLMLDAKNVIN